MSICNGTAIFLIAYYWSMANSVHCISDYCIDEWNCHGWLTHMKDLKITYTIAFEKLIV